MTAAKQAAQFPDDMMTQGNDKQLSDARGRYCNIQQCNIESLKDVPLFWHQFDPILRDAIAPYLWFPFTGASIEAPSAWQGTYTLKNGKL